MQKLAPQDLRPVKLAACLSAILGAPSVAQGAEIAVDLLSSAIAEDGLCSLAEAINNANSDSKSSEASGECAAGSGGDRLLLPDAGIAFLIDELPVVSSTISVSGNQAQIRSSDRLFAVVSGGNLTLEELFMRGYYFGTHSAVTTEAGTATTLTNVSIRQFEGTGITNAGRMHIENSIINGNAGERVGGISNSGSLNLVRSTVSSNGIHNFGGTGGLTNFEGGTVEISHSLFLRNQTGGHVGRGGGIKNFGQMEIAHSTFAENVAREEAGAIYNAGELTIRNSTFFENDGFFSAGAIANTQGAELSLVHCTFEKNIASEGAASFVNFGQAVMANSIFSGGTGLSECDNHGTLLANLHNWIMDGSCAGDFQGDPGLEQLRNNGGATPTSALLHTSNAIDLGAPKYCLASDQRDMARSDGFCDLGAFELVDDIVSLGFEAQR